MTAHRPLRVAHVIQNLNYGGMERVLHNLAHRLPAHGVEVHVVVIEYLGRFAEGLDDVVTFHQVPPMTRWSFVHPTALVDILRQIGPDVVHSHAGVWIKAARAARIARVPVIVQTDHGRPDPVPLIDRLVDGTASRWTDAVIAVSEALAGVLRREVVRSSAAIEVITNGVDVDRLQPPADRAPLRTSLGLPHDALVVGSIGRLEPVKHYDLALQALARLQASGPAVHLALIGDGSERPMLTALAGQLGIADRVHFCGWRKDAEQLYGAFDLFTLPSRSEGTSISLLEAMSAGLCPVVTDVGGNRSVLGPELARTQLVPDDDPAALAAAWSRDLAAPEARARIGALARERVRTAFSLEQMVEAHVGLYRRLLAQKGAAR
jgi:glycosyltransferase involved in cell wall biosynthesis